jgi:hypothetical protein
MTTLLMMNDDDETERSESKISSCQRRRIQQCPDRALLILKRKRIKSRKGIHQEYAKAGRRLFQRQLPRRNQLLSIKININSEISTDSATSTPSCNLKTRPSHNERSTRAPSELPGRPQQTFVLESDP